MSFKALGLPTTLVEIIEKQEYNAPYPIQKAAIPKILKGRDVLGIAPTGSGKTASYVLPVLSGLRQRKEAKNRQVDVLVLVPTRELAEQVKDVFTLFEKGLEHTAPIMAVYGGVSINPQMKGLFGISILVATPGRLLDLVDSNAIQFDKLQTLILDEADKLLNLGFKEEMNKIFALLPKKRQNLLFSATLNEKVEEIHQFLLHDPEVINVAPKEKSLENIRQLAYTIAEEKKGPLLRHLIKSENMQQVLVFTASTYKSEHVADKLHKNGIDARSIHGKKSQHARIKALEAFKAGKLRVLVATDLLARGIDIEFLSHVINYELPRSPKDYVHRIGRTGRADATGEAISLISPEEEHHFRVIQKKMKISVALEDGNVLQLK